MNGNNPDRTQSQGSPDSGNTGAVPVSTQLQSPPQTAPKSGSGVTIGIKRLGESIKKPFTKMSSSPKQAIAKSSSNLLFGVFRLPWDPVWNVQVILFLLGGFIEWLLIAQLLQNAAKVTKVEISMGLPALCAAVAVMHQFLILRNIEVDRDTVRNTSPFAKAIVRLLSIMLSVFLLATITGEVPYLLSLLLFKYGPAGYWVHKFDFLNVFSDYQGWTNVTFQTLQFGFPLYCKGLFFMASLSLSVSVLAWDLVELVLGRLKDKYPAWQAIPVWCIFIASDILSILIWWQFWKVLKVISRIPSDAFAAGIFPAPARTDILSHTQNIVFLTFVYALVVVVVRVLVNTLSQRKAADIHQEIV